MAFRRMLLAGWVAGLLLIGLPVAAQTPSFHLPVDCDMRETCWLVQYFDQDAGPGAQDYLGGSRSYNGHTGTDFGVTDYVLIARGVPVVAAANGTVVRVIDGQADHGFGELDLQSLEGPWCGNGVYIDHGDGWLSHYCHLRQGSVAVSVGEEISVGDFLGLVGQSGAAEFPHVEFGVSRNGEPIDPFSPLSGGSLWADPDLADLRYNPVDIYNFGFADGGVDWPRAQIGAYDDREFPLTAEALVIWLEAFGVRQGDRLHMSLRAPDGTVVFAENEDIERTQIRIFRFFGRKRPGPSWPVGIYKAELSITRQIDGIGRGHSITTEITVR